LGEVDEDGNIIAEKEIHELASEKILLFQVFWYGLQSCEGLTICTQKVSPFVLGIMAALAL
jgi:hypothetical protein